MHPSHRQMARQILERHGLDLDELLRQQHLPPDAPREGLGPPAGRGNPATNEQRSHGPQASQDTAIDSEADVRAVFDGLDKNHNGEVDAREFIIALRREASASAVAMFTGVPAHVQQEARLPPHTHDPTSSPSVLIAASP